MRLLFLSRGLSFRFGGQFSTEVAKSWTIVSQAKACKSQIRFIENISEKHNLEINLVIDTFSTCYDDNLKKYYEKLNVEYNFIKTLDNGNSASLNRAINNIKPKLKDYDFLIISRNDMIYQPLFSDLFTPNKEQFIFPFVCWYQNRKLDNNNPRIADTFFFFPKKYFYLLKYFNKPIGDYHDILSLFLEENQIDFSPIINTYHDSDSAKDWNPLYKLAGRTEKLKNDSLSNLNLLYPEDF